MTQTQRLARVEELRAKARDTYLPLHEQQQQLAKGQPVTVAEPANDNAVEQVDELLLKRERHV